ncbi:exonuclease domain-containing protein [Paenibacillus sediminis]|uniref:DNA polymerase-3 subunit epsilon n=1 Tax=Paenibacillus sediminis TaxID=664909 RepID=A0ABS4H5H5_9BACL|nr:exonuclease domain-containing protein [Paenibacillus sediminis]MBP1937736.1 DNA polymerase-3 subunit epsilon [Paenibacillus sediminis]
MKEPVRGNNSFWSALRSGGMSSAIASMRGTPTAQQIAFMRSLSKEQRKPETLHIPLTELEIIVFDLETTGFLYQHGDEILSFGAVKVIGDTIIEEDSFYSLVNVSGTISPAITELTGITADMAAEAPPLMDVLHQFMSFVGSRVMLAHASSHDKAFLNTALWKTSKLHFSHRVIDTVMIARWLEPARSSYGLDELLVDRGIPITIRHHALEDAKMTAQLWISYLSQIRQRQVVTLGDLYAYLSRS